MTDMSAAGSVAAIPGRSPLRLLHITDSHLFPDVDGALLGVNTETTLRAVLEQARGYALSGAPQAMIEPDLILMTGDIAQKASDQTYERFLRIVRDYFPEAPIAWLAGNHDAIMPLARTAARTGIEQGLVSLPGWQVILLDSHLEGHVPGRFALSALEQVRQQLNANPDLPTLLAFHHQPVDIGSAWIDTQRISNAAALFELCVEFPSIKGMLFGHVHQEVDLTRYGVRMLGSPSTCFQFKPFSEDYALDDAPPGCRWLTLHRDGQLETEVQRVAGLTIDLDVAASGY